jgi:DNA processing protein
LTAASPIQQLSGVSDAERAAACALAGLAGIGAQSLSLIRTAFGSLAEAVRRPAAELANVPGLRADGIESLRKSKPLELRGEWLLTQARRLGSSIFLLGEADYPSLLASSLGPPPVLYVRGSLPDVRRVSVVGTRYPDDYGQERTRVLVDHICSSGLEVTSGGAEGIDATAHRRALERGARTVAVIGSGFLNPFPASHRKLFDQIAEQGALVSEFAVDAGGNRTHFPQRNRTMAGLSEAVVITRGKADSGALMTCQAAFRNGRSVFAVPGNVGDPLAAAPNQMLVQGARAVLSGAEVVKALGLAVQPVDTRSESSNGGARGPAPADVSTLPIGMQRLYAALGPAPRHVDDIAAEAGTSSSEALGLLLQLELANLCVARPGAHFVRR